MPDPLPPFNQAHLEVLKSIRGEGCKWLAAKVPEKWAEGIGIPTDKCQLLLKTRPDRREVFEFLQNANAELSSLTVLSWGGMKSSHGRIATGSEAWLKMLLIVEQLFSGKLSRADAYDLFAKFRTKNPGFGIGPAYFTKLIYFLRANKESPGYIMDQWTSLSVNLLFKTEDKPIVHMIRSASNGQRSDTVSDRNTADTYETFCRCIEALAQELGVDDPATAEEWIFSGGGRNPAPWRQYVRRNRPD